MSRRGWWVAIAFLLAVSAPRPASAQPESASQIRLTGRVYDEMRRPIADVEVIVNRSELRTSSDAAGLFSLVLTPLDSTLGFRRIGYRPILVSLRPLPSNGDTILVQLLTSSVQLPDLIVSAAPSKPVQYAGTTKYDDVFLRRKIGLGNLITREVIRNRFGVSTAEILQGIPGIHYHHGPPTRLRFARCPEPGAIAVYIDGMRQIPAGRIVGEMGGGGSKGGLLGLIRPPSTEDGPEIELLSRVNPSDIEMIEVFRGASEIPGVFHWNGCAVVAVWTRWNR